MERTTCFIGGSSPLKGYEVTYNVFDLRQIEYSVYCLLRYHSLESVHLFVVYILCRLVFHLQPFTVRSLCFLGVHPGYHLIHLDGSKEF